MLTRFCDEPTPSEQVREERGAWNLRRRSARPSHSPLRQESSDQKKAKVGRSRNTRFQKPGHHSTLGSRSKVRSVVRKRLGAAQEQICFVRPAHPTKVSGPHRCCLIGNL